MKIDGALMSAGIEDAGRQAKAQEEIGYDGLYSFEGPHDPFFPLALASQSTERLELGTGVAIAFARNPMICAQIAQDLQRLSRGRFILGLGTQIRPHIEKRFSQPWSKPAARMREFVQAIRAIWLSWSEGGRLDFRGEFYSHTLMTPMFNPGPNPFGDPRIFLAGVGPLMTQVGGEVADGFYVHPLNSRRSLEDLTLPALERGLAASGRSREDFEICCQTIVCLGRTPEQVETARRKARTQIAFYGSTPAYRVILDLHGWGELQPRLNRMTKSGQWAEMPDLIDDEMLDAIAISGTPSEVGAGLVERHGDLCERTGLGLYNEAGPEAVAELIGAAKS